MYTSVYVLPATSSHLTLLQYTYIHTNIYTDVYVHVCIYVLPATSSHLTLLEYTHKHTKHIYIYVHIYTCPTSKLLPLAPANSSHLYGVATMSRLLQIAGLFCRILYVL